MSAVYNAMACFLMIVPFGARGSGLSGLVINIISLNILANAGTEEFASSTDGLQSLGTSFLAGPLNRYIPYLVSKFNQGVIILGLYGILRVRLYEHSGLLSSTPEHHSALD